MRCACLLIALAILSHHALPAHGVTFLAKSTVEMCVNDNNNPVGSNNATCSKKLVATLSFDSNDQWNNHIQTIVRSAVDSAGTTQVLQEPLLIMMAKSGVRTIYPLKYLQSVNNRPWELSFYTASSSFLGGLFSSSCVDSVNADRPSCGYAIDNKGQRVPDSVGICCSCSFTEQLGLSSSGDIRAPMSCSLFGSGQSSAHCLRMDPLWYNVYSIGNAQFEFTITIAVYKPEDSAPFVPDPSCESAAEIPGWRCSAMLSAGPRARGSKTKDGSVVVQYVGDFALTTAITTMSDKYLLVPEDRVLPFQEALVHPQIVRGTQDWLIVDKTAVDLTGRTCDKVGVSYSAFRLQNRACSQPLGSCLREQPYDLWKRDYDAREAGKALSYFPAAYGTFSLLIDTADTRYLAYELEQNHASVVTLSLNADDMRFVTNRAAGVITMALINDFEAIRTAGELVALVASQGQLSAQFTLQVECSRFILPIPARTQSIAAGRSWLARFPIYTLYQLSATNFCVVTLLDSLLTVLDSKNITFRTNATCVCLGVCGCQCDSNTSVVKCVPIDNPDINDAGGSPGGGISLGGLFGAIGLSVGSGAGLCSVIFFLIIVCVVWKMCGASLRAMCGRSKGGDGGRQDSHNEDSSTTIMRLLAFPLVALVAALGFCFGGRKEDSSPRRDRARRTLRRGSRKSKHEEPEEQQSSRTPTMGAAQSDPRVLVLPSPHPCAPSEDWSRSSVVSTGGSPDSTPPSTPPPQRRRGRTGLTPSSPSVSSLPPYSPPRYPLQQPQLATLPQLQQLAAALLSQQQCSPHVDMQLHAPIAGASGPFELPDNADLFTEQKKCFPELSPGPGMAPAPVVSATHTALPLPPGPPMHHSLQPEQVALLLSGHHQQQLSASQGAEQLLAGPGYPCFPLAERVDAAPLVVVESDMNNDMQRQPEPVAIPRDVLRLLRLPEVFFNFARVNPIRIHRVLQDPGRQFSLRGRLVLAQVSSTDLSFRFTVGAHNQQTCTRLAPLEPPKPLPGYMCDQILAIGNVRKFVTAAASYTCIN